MAKHPRGLLDTSVVIDLERVGPDEIPDEFAISTVTLAELSAGPLAAGDPATRAVRQDRLQRVEANIRAIPLDRDAARAYARVYAATVAAGRRARARFADHLIAATAIASNLPLYTRNAADFAHLCELLEVVEI